MILFFKMITADLYDVSRLVSLQLLHDLRHCSCTTTTKSLSGVVGLGGWVPTNFHVHSQLMLRLPLMLRLSWAVTIFLGYTKIPTYLSYNNLAYSLFTAYEGAIF